MSLFVVDSFYFLEIQDHPAKVFCLSMLKIIKTLLVKYLFKNMILHFLESLEIGKYKQDNLPFLSIPTAIPEFVTQVNVALEALNKNSLDAFDDNQFVDISKKIYDTIHDIRCSVMMIRVSLFYLH